MRLQQAAVGVVAEAAPSWVVAGAVGAVEVAGEEEPTPRARRPA